MKEFQAHDAVLLGISADNRESHLAFAEAQGYQFNLLVDADNAVRKAYGAVDLAGLIPGRVTYVVARTGLIAGFCNSAIDMKLHAQRALELLDGLSDN